MAKIEGGVKTTLFSVIINVAVIVLVLFLSVNASAFILNLNSDKEEVVRGNKINFNFSVQIQEDDPNITQFNIDLVGPQNVSCAFDSEGNLIDSCPGFTVTKKSSGEIGYGYGYGYGGGNLEFEIIFDSTLYKGGFYDIDFSLVSGNETFIKSKEIRIIENILENITCSVRAKSGNATLDDINFKKNTISLFVPLKNARLGTGSIVLQEKKERFSIALEGNRVIHRDDDVLIMLADGIKSHEGVESDIDDIVITIDKKNKKLSVEDLTGELKIKDMRIYLIKGC